jgi:hypothetical protein
MNDCRLEFESRRRLEVFVRGRFNTVYNIQKAQMKTILQAWVLFPLLLLEASAVPLYYCNSGNLTGQWVLGMADGMYLFMTNTGYQWYGARDTCKTWPTPFNGRNVQFKNGDVMNTNPSLIQPSLAVLKQLNNLNFFLNFSKTMVMDAWIGLGQNIDGSSCSLDPLPNVYESSFNWTWLDGTPLLQDSRGQGLVYFGAWITNNANSAHARSDAYSSIVDARCDGWYAALCSIPRTLFDSSLYN